MYEVAGRGCDRKEEPLIKPMFVPASQVFVPNAPFLLLKKTDSPKLPEANGV